MAERLGRPHDRTRTVELRAAASKLDEKQGILVRFLLGDVRHPGVAPRGQHVVLAGGLLGGVLSSRGEVAAALSSIASALAPGGRAFVADRFRADRAERARELVRELAPAAGLELVAPGELALAPRVR
jgi:hypothetical protein